MADEGCDVIMLMNSHSRAGRRAEAEMEHSPVVSMAGLGGMEEVDDDDVHAALEACLWNDVVGAPMSSRVGLSAAGSATTGHSPWQAQVEAALELNVKHFDVCFEGASAPRLSDLAGLLSDHGAVHNVDVQAARKIRV
jgi:hypothetical protein